MKNLFGFALLFTIGFANADPIYTVTVTAPTKDLQGNPIKIVGYQFSINGAKLGDWQTQNVKTIDMAPYVGNKATITAKVISDAGVESDPVENIRLLIKPEKPGMQVQFNGTIVDLSLILK